MNAGLAIVIFLILLFLIGTISLCVDSIRSKSVYVKSKKLKPINNYKKVSFNNQSLFDNDDDLIIKDQ